MSLDVLLPAEFLKRITAPMTALELGEKVKVRHEDVFKYILEVEVTAICPDNEFIGRVERIFSDGGEITGGNILALKGNERKFRNDDILPMAH